MDWIVNREIAFIFWIFLFGCTAMVWSGARPHAISLVRSMFNIKVIIVVLIGGLSAFVIFKGLSPEEGWTPRQNWLAMYWYFTVGIGLTASAISQTNDANYSPVLATIVNGIKFTAILEFVANTQSMHLLIELFLVPLLFILFFSTQTQISKTIPKNVLVLYERTLVVIPLVIVAVSIISIANDPGNFFTVSTLRDFLVPLLLTIFHIFYLIILYIYTNYENAYIRVKQQIKDPKLVRYAMLSAFTSFGPMLKRLKHWVNIVQTIDPKSEKDVQFTLKHGNNLTPLMDLYRNMPR